eukprot:g28469.t1
MWSLFQMQHTGHPLPGATFHAAFRASSFPSSFSGLAGANRWLWGQLHSRECFRPLVMALPPLPEGQALRRRIWHRLLLGAMELAVEGHRFEDLSQRPSEADAEIQRDVGRTFPERFDEATQQALFRVLRAVSHRVEDIGYCQGMNFIAGVMLCVFRSGATSTALQAAEPFAYHCVLSMLLRHGMNQYFGAGFPKLRLRTASPVVPRYKALFSVRQSAPSPHEAVAILSSALPLQEDSVLLRHEAAYVLGQLGDASAIPVLQHLLLDDTWQIVRHEAAEALAALGSEKALAELAELLAKGDTSEALRHTCATQKDIPWAASTLSDQSLPLFERYRGMFTLRNLGGDEAVKSLAEALLQDNSSAVLRHEVAFVLGQMADETATKAGEALDFQNEFPSGVLVEAHSLSATEMNGLQGRVLGPQEERLRVDFPQPAGVKALKPSNLKIIEVEPEKGVEDFPIGAMVEAFGLSKIELNGLRGKVLGPREDRVEVKFDDGPKALKPSNLKLIE